MRKPENLDSICETKEIQLFTLGHILYCFKFKLPFSSYSLSKAFVTEVGTYQIARHNEIAF